MAVDRGGAHGPLVELTLARLRQFVREPEAIFWTFAFPILMAVAMTVAFPNRAAAPVRVVVADGDGGPDAAAAMRRALTATPAITLRTLAPGAEARALREGEVHLIVVPGTPPTYRYDPSRDESRVARLVVDDVLQRGAGRSDPWQARDETLQVPGSRYVDWLLPGLIGMTIMGTGMWGLGFSITQARMQHLLKRFLASPMQRRDYLAAQLLARMVFLAPEVAIPLGFGVIALGMPVHGSVAAITVVSAAGALAFGAIGLLAASRARTIEGISGVLNVVMLPMWMLSGVFFSSANYPAAAQPAIRLLPLTALVDALRVVVLDGSGLGAVVPELAVLVAWTVFGFAAALRLFRWR